MKNKKLLLMDIYITFLKLGAFSFGGGYAMIPLIEREVVVNKKWIDKEKIVDVFSVSESLPGAIALNSSAFVGYTVAGIPGAVAALLGNLTPSGIIVLLLSILISSVGSNPSISVVFNGIRPAIVGLIAYAAVKIGKTAIKDYITVVIMIVAFIGALFFKIAPITLIVFGAISGIVVKTIQSKLAESKFYDKLEARE